MKLSRLLIVALFLMSAPSVFSQVEGTIRSVDFANFTYPSAPHLPKQWRKPYFKLRNGELTPKRNKAGLPVTVWLKLGWVHYFDVTGDGIDEAIVDLEWITGGSAIPNLIYIYTMRGSRQKLLWTFQTGDRADGGLKDIRAEKGRLVLELYGKNKILGRDLYADDGTKNGDCCPTMFTRTRYLWRGNRFWRVGSAEVFRLER
jgi:hypothetical protein